MLLGLGLPAALASALLLPTAPLRLTSGHRKYSRASSPPVLCDTPPEGGWEAYEWWEDGQTCVEYADAKSGQTLLGVYNAYTMVESEPHITPLCAVDEDDGVACLYMDEDSAPVPLSAVTRVLDADYVFVSERQAGGGQGLGNPHGEHGETVYDLRDVEISEGVTLVLREGRDTERVL